MVCAATLRLAAQDPPARPPTGKDATTVKPAPRTPPVDKTSPAPPPWPADGDRGDHERSIAVDQKVNVQMCITEGSVKINGWARDEVRVFVRGGSSVGFKILQKSPRSGSPVWIMLLNAPPKGMAGPITECLSGDEIEIDVPAEAVVKLKGRETRVAIEGIRKAWVEVGGGDISVRDVSDGVTATTFEGDVMVGDSQGAINLQTTSGNIVAFGASPGQVGDSFKAKTHSGAIVLERLDFRQIEVNSISGTLVYNGRFESGGLYTFGTQNGTISLVVPADSSATVSATYGFGDFSSELPLKDVQKVGGAGPRGLTASLGPGGDAKLNISTTNGTIRIRKQQ